jgi:glyoxylase-like metal-dependent hydrolase (beta-lactamase superfamily II)
MHLPILIQFCLFSQISADESFTIHSLTLGGSRAYLLETNGGLLLIDAGYPGNEKKVINYMQKLGRSDLKLIFLTHGHFDHYGSAAALKHLTGARIAIHRADSAALANGETPLGKVRSWGRISAAILPLATRIWKVEGVKPDTLLKDGDLIEGFGVKIQVMHAPGHTPGSCCLIVNDTIAFVGDLIATKPVIFVQKYYAHDWEGVAQSLQRLKRIGPARIYCGHGSRVLNKEQLDRLKEAVKK